MRHLLSRSQGDAAAQSHRATLNRTAYAHPSAGRVMSQHARNTLVVLVLRVAAPVRMQNFEARDVFELAAPQEKKLLGSGLHQYEQLTRMSNGTPPAARRSLYIPIACRAADNSAISGSRFGNRMPRGRVSLSKTCRAAGACVPCGMPVPLLMLVSKCSYGIVSPASYMFTPNSTCKV